MARPRPRGSDIASELENADRLIKEPDKQWGWGGPAGRERVARRVRFVADVLDARPGRTLLELGCGTGIFTAGMARTGANIVGVDIASVLLADARKKLGDAPNVELVNGDLMDPGTLAGRHFNAVYGISVLHHLDLERALPAVRKAVGSGARFAFSEPNIDNPLNRYWYYAHSPRRRARHSMSNSEMAFSRDELDEILRRHGFIPAAVQFRDFLHPSTPGALVPLVDRLGRALERLPLTQRASGSLWAHGHVA